MLKFLSLSLVAALDSNKHCISVRIFFFFFLISVGSALSSGTLGH